MTETETEAAEPVVEMPDVAAPPKRESRTKFDYADEALDEQLEKHGLLDDGDGDEDEKPVELPEPEVAKGDELEEGAELEEELEPEEDQELEEADEPEAEEDEDMALHRAWTFLHDELNVPASVLKTTPKEKLIAWGAEARARAKAETEAEADDGSSGETKSGATKDTKGGPAQAPTSDWSAVSKSIANELGVDDAAADRAFRPVFEALDGKVQALEARLEAAETAARTREGQATIDMQVRRLSAHYPQLKGDQAARGKLVQKAVTLFKTGEYEGRGPRAVFDDAAQLVLGKPKRSDLAQLRRNGVSHVEQSRGQSSLETSSENDYFAKATDYALAGRADLIKRLKPPPNLRKPERHHRR